ncbi:hypothetical protein SHPE106448_00585 [Shewanella pealeana]
MYVLLPVKLQFPTHFFVKLCIILHIKARKLKISRGYIFVIAFLCNEVHTCIALTFVILD